MCRARPGICRARRWARAERGLELGERLVVLPRAPELDALANEGLVVRGVLGAGARRDGRRHDGDHDQGQRRARHRGDHFKV